MSRFTNLSDWLVWLEKSHPKSIDLGLERVFSVAKNLNLLDPPSEVSHDFSGALQGLSESGSTVITIAGTNGKGSCVSTIEQALLYKRNKPSVSNSSPVVGSYTSPHFHNYCERIKVDGIPVSETLVCEAFAEIDKARASISLSYFEFGTLAALWIFIKLRVPVVLLEVGLGGRLDAVNIVDPDIAVVTSIDLDHQDWLGDNRDTISREKLGISRQNRPLIIAETQLTPHLLDASNRDQALLIGRDFHILEIDKNLWQFKMGDIDVTLPIPSLPFASVAAAMVVIELMGRSSTLLDDYSELMKTLQLQGRYEKANIGDVEIIYDVAHNPAASMALAKRLASSSVAPNKTVAIFAAMQDKDCMAVVGHLLNEIDTWYLGDLKANARALKAKELSEQIASASFVRAPSVFCSKSIEEAFDFAVSQCSRGDRVVVFGSFFTVAAIQTHLSDSLSITELNSATE